MSIVTGAVLGALLCERKPIVGASLLTTRISAVADRPPPVAVICTTPVCFAVATPSGVTLTTAGLLDAQENRIPGTSLPSESSAMAFNSRVFPNSNVLCAGVTTT